MPLPSWAPAVVFAAAPSRGRLRLVWQTNGRHSIQAGHFCGVGRADPNIHDNPAGTGFLIELRLEVRYGERGELELDRVRAVGPGEGFGADAAGVAHVGAFVIFRVG